MRVGDMPPFAFPAACAVLGAAGGVLGGRLADALPPRYDITHLTKGERRSRRNTALVVLSAAAGLGLGLVLSAHPDTHVAIGSFYVAVNLLLVVGLLAAAAIDVEHMILPDEITIGGVLLSVATAHWRAVGLRGAAVGAVVGFLVGWLPAIVYRYVRGRGGQGAGDTKLLVMAGAWLGTEGALFVLFAGAIQSLVATLAMRLLGIRYQVPESVRADIEELKRLADAGDEEAKAVLAADPMAADAGDGFLATRLPLGPFLALGCLEMLYARRAIVDAFVRYLAPS